VQETDAKGLANPSSSLKRRVSCELAPHGFGVERAIGNGPEHVDQTTFRSWDAIISKGATATASMRCWPPPATTSVFLLRWLERLLCALLRALLAALPPVQIA
jgi:hypothetical protein